MDVGTHCVRLAIARHALLQNRTHLFGVKTCNAHSTIHLILPINNCYCCGGNFTTTVSFQSHVPLILSVFDGEAWFLFICLPLLQHSFASAFEDYPFLIACEIGCLFRGGGQCVNE